MFGIARTIIRHKVGAIAIVAIGAFFLMPNGEEEQVSTNPWSAQAQTSAVASAEESGLVDDLITEAGDFLDENGISTSAVSDQTVGRMDGAAEAYEGANK